jgi:hypothetical protein
MQRCGFADDHRGARVTGQAHVLFHRCGCARQMRVRSSCRERVRSLTRGHSISALNLSLGTSFSPSAHEVSDHRTAHDIIHQLALTCLACAQLALKIILNILTTGAQVVRGNVFQNSMINVTVSNNKLYHRSAALVSKLADVPLEQGYTALLRGAPAPPPRCRVHLTIIHTQPSSTLM